MSTTVEAARLVQGASSGVKRDSASVTQLFKAGEGKVRSWKKWPAHVGNFPGGTEPGCSGKAEEDYLGMERTWEHEGQPGGKTESGPPPTPP